MVFSFRFEWLLAIPNIPKAFPWLNFLPREFTPLYGLYPLGRWLRSSFLSHMGEVLSIKKERRG